MDQPSGQPDLSLLGKELLAYWDSHPQAKDSLEGIVEWWMLERDIQRRMEEVRKTLAELTRLGLVEEIRTGGTIQYRRAHRQ